MLIFKRRSGGSSDRGKSTGLKISTDATSGGATNLDDGEACSGKYESGSGTRVVGLTVRALDTAGSGNELGSIARFAA